MRLLSNLEYLSFYSNGFPEMSELNNEEISLVTYRPFKENASSIGGGFISMFPAFRLVVFDAMYCACPPRKLLSKRFGEIYGKI